MTFKRVSINILSIIFFLILSFSAWSQVEFSKEEKKTMKVAMEAFEEEDFITARIYLKQLFRKYPDDFEINYLIGACYLNTRYQKTDAIPYLNKAVEEGEEYIPSIVHKDLGNLNHSVYYFDKAIYHYKRFLKVAERGDEYIPYCNRMIEICNNAKELIVDTLNLQIVNIGKPVNTKHSEFAPYVSTDDSILFFTRRNFYTDEELILVEKPDTVDRLYLSYFKKNHWSDPIEIEMRGIDAESGVSVAGMSPDGEYIYVNAFRDQSHDIFVARYEGGNTLNFEPLPEPINTKYWEGKVTISPDGNALWFASDRPGGIGGKDIYKVEKLPSGQWGNPENMGELINTIYDENAPFIHPGGNIFYFSSKGHNTMGGYDIFSVLLNENKVLLPVNMGFPINTTGDDTYFVLSANGNTGYFSSSYGNKYKSHDLYKIKMNLNIPITLVKGYIQVGDPIAPIAAKIRVIDNETGKSLRYVYNPNPKTGKYLMIFPPAKNYDMIVEAEGYTPKNINIYIPDQEEFYELYQNIYMKAVLSAGKKVGEELKVENLFFDTHVDTTVRDYSVLFKAIDAIIEATDSLDQKKIESKGFEVAIQREDEDAYASLFGQIDKAFELGDVATLNAIQEDVIVPDRYGQVYFYPENKTDEFLEKVIIGFDTILTAPKLLAYNDRPRIPIEKNDLIKREEVTIDTINEMIIIERPKEIVITPVMLKESNPEKRKTVVVHKVFFAVNKFEPNKNYIQEYDEIAELLVNNNQLGVVLTGYADSQGTIPANKSLSQKRALNVLESLKDLGINPNKAIIIAKGEEEIVKEYSEKEKAFNRRVEIRVFELMMQETIDE
ncbi:MAG: OmpA family protein [Salinivirgaceae bacterium]|nr:OmpA family protein [Salinivirgaceae bacterium]